MKEYAKWWNPDLRVHHAVDAHAHIKSGEPESLLDVSFSARMLHAEDITCIRLSCPFQGENSQLFLVRSCIRHQVRFVDFFPSYVYNRFICEYLHVFSKF